jgi:hypothetical protein
MTRILLACNKTETFSTALCEHSCSQTMAHGFAVDAKPTIGSEPINNAEQIPVLQALQKSG